MTKIIRCDECGYEENYSFPKYTERRTFQERYKPNSIILHICSKCVVKLVLSPLNSKGASHSLNTDYDSESNDSTPQGDIGQSSTSHNQ